MSDIPHESPPSSPVQKRLGEVALRVRDLESMTAFYKDIIQLTLLRQTERMSFLKIADGYEGHTAVLALFKRREGDVSQAGAMDHLALSIGLEDYEAERRRLEALGLAVRTAIHEWVQWRSLYVDDPEGNEVELVCFDPSIPQSYNS